MSATLRDYLRAILDSRIDEADFTTEIASLIQKSDSWTPVIRGSGTAGTYEIGTNQSRYSRIGRRVFLDVYIQLAGSITAGGTVALNITGLPLEKAANTYPVGAIFLVGVNWTAGANHTLAFAANGASGILVVQESIDDASNALLQISSLAASDFIIGSICYETDDL